MFLIMSASPVFAQEEEVFSEEISEEPIQWATDSTPFKIRKKIVEKTEKKPEEFKKNEVKKKKPPVKKLSPHEIKITDLHKRNAESLESFQQGTPETDLIEEENVLSLFDNQRRRRSGAGGIQRGKTQAKKKGHSTRKSKKAQKQTQPQSLPEKEKGVVQQQGLRMFDDETAKEVMDFDPENEDPELKKMSPKEKEELLNRIIDEKIDAHEQEKRGKEGKRYKNVKDNPYGKY